MTSFIALIIFEERHHSGKWWQSPCRRHSTYSYAHTVTVTVYVDEHVLLHAARTPPGSGIKNFFKIEKFGRFLQIQNPPFPVQFHGKHQRRELSKFLEEEKNTGKNVKINVKMEAKSQFFPINFQTSYWATFQQAVSNIKSLTNILNILVFCIELAKCKVLITSCLSDFFQAWSAVSIMKAVSWGQALKILLFLQSCNMLSWKPNDFLLPSTETQSVQKGGQARIEAHVVCRRCKFYVHIVHPKNVLWITTL